MKRLTPVIGSSWIVNVHDVWGVEYKTTQNIVINLPRGTTFLVLGHDTSSGFVKVFCLDRLVNVTEAFWTGDEAWIDKGHLVPLESRSSR